MLVEIASGEAEGLIVIQDSVNCEGRSLLKSFVVAAAQRGESVHILSFDVPEEEFKAGFSPEVTSRILFHDGFQDPLGWIGQESALTVTEFSGAKLAARLASASQGPATVVLDSLSWPLLRLPFPLLCQVLVQLPWQANVVGLSITRLVVLLHGDWHQPGQLAALHALARVVVVLEPAPGAISTGEGVPQAAVILHRKKRSKVLQKKEYFSVLAGFVLKHISELPQDPGKEPEDSKTPPAADPTANLTFNLRLSEAERQAKESVPLPYHFTEEKKSSLLQVPTSQGKIYYEPDAADDIDEEDPDDDLDV